MIGLIGRLSARVSRLSTIARLACLNGALGLVLIASLAIGATRHGAAGTYAVLVAFAVCGAAANAALILATLWHGTPNGVTGALAGSLVGMLPPLFIGFVLNQQGGELARAGVFGWILVFYLSALLVKTVLTAPNVAAPAGRLPGAAAGNSSMPGSSITEAGA